MNKRTGCGCSPLFWIVLIVTLALLLFVEAKVEHWKLSLPVLPVQISPGSLKVVAASLSHTQAPASPSSYVVTGAPSISAAFINEVLTASHSPAAGTGQALYDLGVQYGIDPVFALAFFQHESSFGRFGMASVTRSLGNLRCIAGYACYQGYAAFSSWKAGYQAWYKLIRTVYVNQWHLMTVAQIVPTYAPENDHNDVAGYITAIEHAVDTWRKGQVRA